MKLYNSYSQKIEELKPIKENHISMYVCGPTVYNYPHIGNARPIVVFDTLKKALEVQGYDVTFVSNYTDVDDKIINTAIENNVSEKEITDKYIKAYNEVRLGLHADLPDVSPRVTETMDKIIDFIAKLIEKGAAYQVDGDVYFRIESDPTYGELSHQNMEDLVVGARIDENSKKENPLDFTLWKATDKGIQWDSPWSKGRPGWHTECVVM
ncbi:MAG: class I tRNA ligase family protein, partial [Erysipelotrichaceae bacterium]|nr:class I tRNA ligase family protein [Erysipelotrichaceae bacterium]